MGRVFHIPWIGGSNTMCRVFDVPWVAGENTIGMAKGFDIPSVEFKIPVVGGRYTMGWRSKYQCEGF